MIARRATRTTPAMLSMSLIVALWFPVESQAREWILEPGTRVLQRIIRQEAVSGDTLTLLNGVFYENLALSNSDWTIRASNPGMAILDGSLADSSVIFFEGGRLVLDGVVIQNGSGVRLFGSQVAKYGGGVCVLEEQITSHFLATRCVFRNNRVIGSGSEGGGVWTNSAGDVAIVDCLFENNESSWEATALWYFTGFGSLTITTSRFLATGNDEMEHSFVSVLAGGSLTVDDCQFVGPGRVSFSGIDMTVSGSVFDKTYTVFGEPWQSPSGTVVFRNNLLVGDAVTPGQFGVWSAETRFECTGNTLVYQEMDFIDWNRSGAIFTNNILFETEGRITSRNGPTTVECVVAWPEIFEDVEGTLDLETDVVVANPQFCDSVSWKIKPTSPCLPRNSPKNCQELIGALGPCDEIPVLSRSWGRIKQIWSEKGSK